MTNWSTNNLADYSSMVPLEPISGIDQQIDGVVEGQYLAIRCRADIDVRTHINWGRQGLCAIRIGDNSPFRNVGKIHGERDGGQLSVAVYLKKSPETITVLCEHPQATSVRLTTAKEFQHIVRGNSVNSLQAWPLLPEPLKVQLNAECRIDKAATAILKVEGPSFSKEYTETQRAFVFGPGGPYPNIWLPLDAGIEPYFAAFASNQGADARECHLQVYPLPK